MLRNVLPVVALVCAVVSPCSTAADAQNYPFKPIRLLVGFAPGGNVDVIARLIAQRLSLELGQAVVVDNRGGAGGILAAEVVAKAASDGYTLLVASSGHMVNAALYEKLPYDTVKSFTPIAIVSFAPHILLGSSSLGVTSVKQLIAAAKAKPGTINYGSGGLGSLTHLEGEFLKSAAAINIVHVPYKGVGQALTDLAAGQVQIVFTSTVSGLPFVKSGRVRALAVTGLTRLSFAPEIPTVAESGLPQFVVDSSTGLLGPAGLTPRVVNRLNAELVRFMKSAEMQEVMMNQGAQAVGSSPAEYSRKIVEDVERWKKVVKDGAIPVQRY